MPACRRAGLTNISSRNSRLADDAVLDELVGLFDRFGHVLHVPVRDVGAEDRAQARAGGVDRARRTPTRRAGRRPRTRSRSSARTCRGCRRPSAARPPRTRRAARAGRSGGRSTRAARSSPARTRSSPYWSNSATSASTSRRSGSRRWMSSRVALLPVPDDVGEQAARPRHAAFEEAEPQRREAVRHARQEQRLAQRLVARGEPADVVVHVARRRARHAVRLQRAVEHGRDRRARRTWPTAGRSRTRCRRRTCRAGTRVAVADRTARVAREHRGLEAELAHRVLELVDRELRVEHRHERADRRAVAVRREQVGERAVRGAAPQADELVVGDLEVRRASSTDTGS